MEITPPTTSWSIALVKILIIAFAANISFSHQIKQVPQKATPNILHTFPTPLHSGSIELSISQNISGMDTENLPVYILRQKHYGSGYSCIVDTSSKSVDGFYVGSFFLNPRVFSHKGRKPIDIIRSRLNSIRYTEHSKNYYQLGTEINWCIIFGDIFYYFENEPVDLICLFNELGCSIESLKGCL